MKVAINCFFLRHPYVGLGVYTRELLARLPDVMPEIEYILVTPRDFVRSLEQDPLAEHYTIHPVGSASGVRQFWFEHIAFPRACSSLKADVAHVPYWGAPCLGRTPLIVTIPDIIPIVLRHYRGGPLNQAYFRAQSYAAKHAAGVITISDASKEEIIRVLKVSRHRVHTTHLAPSSACTPCHSDVDIARIRAKYNLPEHYILYFGGFDPRKNVDALLRAWALGQDSVFRNIQLVIAGNLPNGNGVRSRDPRRTVGALGLHQRVRFIGAFEERDKVSLLHDATAFAYLSHYEGFGLPVVEAMACGTPVVTSHDAAIREVVGSAAVFVDPNQDKAICNALRMIISDQNLRSTLRRKGIEQARRFSWTQCARETVAVYLSVSK